MFTLHLNNSTLSGNAKIGLLAEQTNFTFINSTVSGNVQDLGTGGGIVAKESTGQITNSTLVDNVSAEGDGLFAYSSTITLTNSIIANSSSTDCKAVASSIITTGKNWVKDGGAGCGLSAGPSLLTGDPMLGPLADNGGPTLTHLPLTGSPVIGAGDNAVVPVGLLYDQRGIGFPRIAGTLVDIGSIELPVVPPPDIPTGVNATDAAFNDRVAVSWNDVSGEDGFEVYRCSDASNTGTCTQIGTTITDVLAFDDTGANANGSVAYYRVKACHVSNGCSDFSAADAGNRDTGTYLIFDDGFEDPDS